MRLKRFLAGSAVAMVAALLVVFATRSPGPGLDPDGMAYLGSATSLVQQGTLRVPTGEWSRSDSTSALSFWPPGYPAAIAVPVSAGMSAVQGARVINVLSAAVTVVTITLLVGSAVGTVGGVVAAIVVFVTPAVFDVHLSVLSEPLFIACLVLTLAAMVYARDRLVLLGVLSAMAVMVRYAGASVPAAVTFWTLADARYATRRRFWRAFAVALLPAIAIAGWVARTTLAQDRHGTQAFSVYGNWGPTFRQAGETFAQWLAPQVPAGWMQTGTAVVVALVLLILAIATTRDTAASRFRQRGVERVAAVLNASWILFFTYVAVLCASRLFVGGTIPFDWRILAPAIVLLEIIIVTSVAHWWRAYHLPAHIAIGVAALVWVGAAVGVSANDGYYAATEGSDFAGSEWRTSPLLAWVRQSGNGHTLYSNWPPAVYFHTHRIARELPDSTEVRDDLTDFAEAVRASHGVIVGFNAKSPDVVAPDSIAQLLGFRLIARFSDGAVWGP